MPKTAKKASKKAVPKKASKKPPNAIAKESKVSNVRFALIAKLKEKLRKQKLMIKKARLKAKNRKINVEGSEGSMSEEGEAEMSDEEAQNTSEEEEAEMSDEEAQNTAKDCKLQTLFPNPKTPTLMQDNYTILLLGGTGQGKTAFLNLLHNSNRCIEGIDGINDV